MLMEKHPERECLKKRMKRTNFLTKTAIMLMAGGAFFALTSFYSGDRYAEGPRPSQKQAIRTIIIDPGHGGFDSGTSGLFSKEKDVALSISMKLGQLINEAFPDVK